MIPADLRLRAVILRIINGHYAHFSYAAAAAAHAVAVAVPSPQTSREAAGSRAINRSESFWAQLAQIHRGLAVSQAAVYASSQPDTVIPVRPTRYRLTDAHGAKLSRSTLEDRGLNNLDT